MIDDEVLNTKTTAVDYEGDIAHADTIVTSAEIAPGAHEYRALVYCNTCGDMALYLSKDDSDLM